MAAIMQVIAGLGNQGGCLFASLCLLIVVSSKMNAHDSFPRFEDLPLRRPGPPLNAWGLYGDEDELGRLNLITPDVVRRALLEANHGIVINLNMPLSFRPLNINRSGLEHKILAANWGNDDHLAFNTQASTQWDGLRHCPYPDYPVVGEKSYYNGMLSKEASDPNNKKMGVDNGDYARKPITSRAHLLDLPRYRRLRSLPDVSWFDNKTPITLEDIQGCAEEEGIEFRSGDILAVRTGWTDAWAALSEEEQEALPGKWAQGGCCGLATNEEMMKWHWDRRFAAVLTDCAAYEAWPPTQRPSLHAVFLAGWGMPIGETFDLRQLAAKCAELNKWTFLFASVALNVPGGIASTGNAQAIL